MSEAPDKKMGYDTLEAGWKGVFAERYDAPLRPVLVEELRYVFFAGARHMWRSISQRSYREKIPADAAMEFFAAELTAFLDSYIDDIMRRHRLDDSIGVEDDPQDREGPSDV